MKWNKGAPPAVGWWPASNSRNSESWRWWDGHLWSCAAMSRFDSERAARAVEYSEFGQRFIEWRNWPRALRHLPGYPLNPMNAGRTKE